jgi:hypothetical protein
MSTVILEEKRVEAKTYYSRNPRYQACIRVGRLVVGPDGVPLRLDGKYVEFGPPGNVMPGGKTFGMLTTDDPEQIAWLDKQLQDGNMDFLTPEQYNIAIKSPEQRIEEQSQEIEGLSRKLELQNQLLADLARKNPQMFEDIAKKAGK